MPLAPGEKAEPVRVRIYTSTGHFYHVVTINAMIDVAAMIPKLKEKMLGPGQTESYRLYLREHSRGAFDEFLCLEKERQRVDFFFWVQNGC